MSEPTSNSIFIPQTEGCLQAPMAQEGQCTYILCYDYNDVLHPCQFGNDYREQSMLNFFKEGIPEDQQEQIQNQQLDNITKQHNSHSTAYSNNQELKWNYDFLSMRSIYEHQRFIPS